MVSGISQLQQLSRATADGPAMRMSPSMPSMDPSTPLLP